MKKTQMIHSPRTFKFGLGLMLAASMASMPVLTGASERQEAKAAAASKKLTETEERDSESKSKQKSKQQAAAASTKTKMKTKMKTSPKAEGGESKARNTSAADRARDRTAKLELEAKKIADRLTPSQRTKLLALINDSKSGELAAIRGVGKSRSAAIEKARPIESIEDLPKVKGVGLKTLADVVDHGRGTTEPNKATPKRGNSKSESSDNPDGGNSTDPEMTASEA